MHQALNVPSLMLFALFALALAAETANAARAAGSTRGHPGRG